MFFLNEVSQVSNSRMLIHLSSRDVYGKPPINRANPLDPNDGIQTQFNKWLIHVNIRSLHA